MLSGRFVHNHPHRRQPGEIMRGYVNRKAVFIKSQSSVFALEDLKIVKARWNGVLDKALQMKINTIIVDGKTMVNEIKYLTYGLIGLIGDDLRKNSLSLHLVNISPELASSLKTALKTYYGDLAITVNEVDAAEYTLTSYD